MINRPNHLPDYNAPPLNEVVLGIQFRPATGYTQILAKDIWSLFKTDFPLIEEHRSMPPSFETFGSKLSSAPQFQLVANAEHSRYWFINKDQDELIQFQGDRLLHNWRQRGEEPKPYPRFEVMAEQFSKQVNALQEYFKSLEDQELEINQCEISYINHFPLITSEFDSPNDYLEILNLKNENEDLMLGYRRIITQESGQKVGRLYCDIKPAIKNSGELVYVVNLTVRGTPKATSIEEALAFLKNGRDIIVKEFTAITTEKAHQYWERRK